MTRRDDAVGATTTARVGPTVYARDIDAEHLSYRLVPSACLDHSCCWIAHGCQSCEYRNACQCDNRYGAPLRFAQ